MILNPYYFIFSLTYKRLKRIKVNAPVKDEDILFLIYAILFLLFIPHFFIFLFQLKDFEIISFNVNIPKQIFGVSFAILYWAINHFLFGWKNRYIKIIECYDKTSKTIKYINLIILAIYFTIPLILMLS